MPPDLIRYQRDKNSWELYATLPNGKCPIGPEDFPDLRGQAAHVSPFTPECNIFVSLTHLTQNISTQVFRYNFFSNGLFFSIHSQLESFTLQGQFSNMRFELLHHTSHIFILPPKFKETLQTRRILNRWVKKLDLGEKNSSGKIRTRNSESENK